MGKTSRNWNGSFRGSRLERDQGHLGGRIVGDPAVAQGH